MDSKSVSGIEWLYLSAITILTLLILVCIMLKVTQPGFFTNFNFGPVPSTRVELNLFGFVFPAAISGFFLIAYYNGVHSKLNMKSLILVSIYLFGASILTLAALRIPLQGIINNRGVGDNIGIFLLSFLFLMYIGPHKKHPRDAILLSFPTMFFTGFLSDLTILPVSSGLISFGGNGLFDGDLFYPVFFLTVFSWLSLIFKREPRQIKE